MKRPALILTLALALVGCSQAESGAPAAKAAAAAPVQRWTTFRDPAEGAFTLEIPEGWTVEGGSRRMSAVEIRTGVTLRSPDGQVELFVGDNEIPVFAVPTPALSFAGFTEGTTYNPGYGQSFVVESYQAGEQFAAEWGARRTGCAQLKASRALPDATQAIDMAYANGGVRTSIKAGEATFVCPGKAGYVFAATELVESMAGALWNVKVAAGFTAPPNRAAEAGALLSRVVGSFRVDPAWAARQQGLTGAVSRIVAGTNEAVSQSIADAFAYKNRANDRAMEDFSQGMRGVDTFDDPVEGRRELADQPHQWRLPDGRIVSTQTADPPAVGAQELQRTR